MDAFYLVVANSKNVVTLKQSSSFFLVDRVTTSYHKMHALAHAITRHNQS